MKFKGLKVGDTVFVERHAGGSVATVTKVGRKYFSAGRQEFHLEDGRSTCGYTHPRAVTLNEREMTVRVTTAKKALAVFGIEFAWRTAPETILTVFDALRPLLATQPSSKETK